MGREEEATHVAVPRGRRPRHQSRSSTRSDPGTREPIRANECPAAGRHQVSSQWPVGVRDGQTSRLGLHHPGLPGEVPQQFFSSHPLQYKHGWLVEEEIFGREVMTVRELRDYL